MYYRIIKNQIRTIRDLHLNSNPVVAEHVKDIKDKYLIKEDESPRDIN